MKFFIKKLKEPIARAILNPRTGFFPVIEGDAYAWTVVAMNDGEFFFASANSTYEMAREVLVKYKNWNKDMLVNELAYLRRNKLNRMDRYDKLMKLVDL